MTRCGLCLALGVPLILRETNQSNEYRLVGGAYVHGFMQGEALNPDAVLADIKVV